ncbi:MAG: metallophosphoesterase [Deltaproteobacteria bacterium]|nr:metallophosphoesterase [Deltaproteobacteria bacterium]
MAKHFLHISDVHFGPPHRPEVAEGVLRLVDERKPDVVVLSGDLTQRAKPDQFRQARRFVDRISAPTIVVPGNHDVPLYRVWERFLAPFGAYRKYFADELEPILELEDLVMVGVNTAHGLTLKDGKITLPRLQEISRYFRQVPEETYKVIVAHHQLIPPPSFGTQRVLHRAHEAVEVFSDSGVDLVLSGHMHQTYIGSSEEFYPRGMRGVRIVHSGTTTSNRGRGVERKKNTCNWISVDEGSLFIAHLLWSSSRDEFVEQSHHHYPA